MIFGHIIKQMKKQINYYWFFFGISLLVKSCQVSLSLVGAALVDNFEGNLV